MMRAAGSLLFILLGLLSSCVLMPLDTLLVMSVTPDAGTAPSTIQGVSVTFNRAVRHDRAEAALTLTENGKSLAGSFRWDGNATVTFVPALALKDEAKYVLTVERSVEDEKGYGLADAYTVIYGQEVPPARPQVLSVSPSNESEEPTLARPDVVWTFDQAMDAASIQDQADISPSVDGYFSWNTDQTVFTFHPTVDLAWQQQYTLTVPRQTKGANGATLTQESVTRFFHGTKVFTPLTATLTTNGPTLTEGAGVVNTGFEKDVVLTLTSNQDVDTSTVSSQITILPSVPLTLKWDSASPKRVVTINMASLLYGQTYQLTVRKGIKTEKGVSLTADQKYNLTIDGTGSLPLEVTRLGVLEFPDAGSSMYTLLSETGTGVKRYGTLQMGGYPASSAVVNAVIDVYFKNPSPTTTLNAFTLMQGLVLSNPGSDSMTIYGVKQDPAPGDGFTAPSPASDETVVRYYIAYGQNDLTSGFLEFRVSTSILDARGNTLAAEFLFPVFKVK